MSREVGITHLRSVCSGLARSHQSGLCAGLVGHIYVSHAVA